MGGRKEIQAEAEEETGRTRLPGNPALQTLHLSPNPHTVAYGHLNNSQPHQHKEELMVSYTVVKKTKYCDTGDAFSTNPQEEVAEKAKSGSKKLLNRSRTHNLSSQFPICKCDVHNGDFHPARTF